MQDDERRTSRFLECWSLSYVLPVEQAVRRSEGLPGGDQISFRLIDGIDDFEVLVGVLSVDPEPRGATGARFDGRRNPVGPGAPATSAGSTYRP